MPHVPHANNGPPIAPNVFDIKPLDRVTKRKNVITIDVRLDPSKDPRRRDPRLAERARDRRHKKNDDERERKRDELRQEKDKARDNAFNVRTAVDDYIDRLQISDPKKINKLPPIPKINRDENKDDDEPAPTKKRKENPKERRKKKEQNSSKESSSSSSPEKRLKSKEMRKKPKAKLEAEEVHPVVTEPVTFKVLKNFNKDHYMCRNKKKSESPEREPEKTEDVKPKSEPSKISIHVKSAWVVVKHETSQSNCDIRCKETCHKFCVIINNFLLLQYSYWSVYRRLCTLY